MRPQAGWTVSTPVLDWQLRLTAAGGAAAATLEDMLEDALTRGKHRLLRATPAIVPVACVCCFQRHSTHSAHEARPDE